MLQFQNSFRRLPSRVHIDNDVGYIILSENQDFAVIIDLKSEHSFVHVPVTLNNYLLLCFQC